MSRQIILDRVSGRIRNLSVSTVTVDVFITDADRITLKGAAAATALAGSAGLGIGLLGLDTDTSSEADLMAFELEQPDGRLVPVQACVWQAPFNNGDEVEVVGEQIGDMWKGVAVARPADCLVAVYPLCTHGRWPHRKKVIKWWWWITLSLILFGYFAYTALGFFSEEGIEDWKQEAIFFFGVGFGVVMPVFFVIAWSIGHKVSKLVPLSESIFHAFGWKSPKSFDLYATTRAKRRPDDPETLGLSYFRY